MDQFFSVHEDGIFIVDKILATVVENWNKENTTGFERQCQFVKVLDIGSAILASAPSAVITQAVYAKGYIACLYPKRIPLCAIPEGVLRVMVSHPCITAYPTSKSLLSLQWLLGRKRGRVHYYANALISLNYIRRIRTTMTVHYKGPQDLQLFALMILDVDRVFLSHCSGTLSNSSDNCMVFQFDWDCFFNTSFRRTTLSFAVLSLQEDCEVTGVAIECDAMVCCLKYLPKTPMAVFPETHVMDPKKVRFLMFYHWWLKVCQQRQLLIGKEEEEWLQR